jgi:hypothetical protein
LALRAWHLAHDLIEGRREDGAASFGTTNYVHILVPLDVVGDLDRPPFFGGGDGARDDDVGHLSEPPSVCGMVQREASRVAGDESPAAWLHELLDDLDLGGPVASRTLDPIATAQP